MRNLRKNVNRRRYFDKPKNSVRSKNAKKKSEKKLPGRPKKSKS